MKPHGGHRSSKKVANGLVALSSAAVFTVYSAGYLRTRSAAERFAEEARRPVVPAPASESASSAEPRPIVTASAARPSAPAPPPERIGPPSPMAERHAEPPVVAKPGASSPVSVDAPASTVVASAVSSISSAAAVPISTPALDTKTAEPAAPSLPQYKDGTFYGWGTSRHGDIQAFVVIESGHIVTTGISQCLTRYSCSWIAHLPGQVIVRQSADVDYVTGATQSTNAFYYAIVEALSKAK